MGTDTLPGRYPDAVDAIVSPLRTIANRGYSRHYVFEDWLDAMLYSIQGRDKPYLELVERYDPEVAAAAPRDPDDEYDGAMDHFATAFGELLHGSQATGQELLGDVYEVFGHPSDHFGQYFTPHAIAKTMAAIQGAGDGTTEPAASDGPSEPPSDPTTIADPACGSGRLLVAYRPYAPAGIFVGQDKDSVCAKMAAVNLVIFGLSGYAIHGDSLTIDQHRAWEVVNPPFGSPRCIELDPNQDPVPLSDAHWERMSTEASQPSMSPSRSTADEPVSAPRSEEAQTTEPDTSLTQTTLAEIGGLSGNSER